MLIRSLSIRVGCTRSGSDSSKDLQRGMLLPKPKSKELCLRVIGFSRFKSDADSKRLTCSTLTRWDLPWMS